MPRAWRAAPRAAASEKRATGKSRLPGPRVRPVLRGLPGPRAGLPSGERIGRDGFASSFRYARDAPQETRIAFPRRRSATRETFPPLLLPPRSLRARPALLRPPALKASTLTGRRRFNQYKIARDRKFLIDPAREPRPSRTGTAGGLFRKFRRSEEEIIGRGQHRVRTTESCTYGSTPAGR